MSRRASRSSRRGLVASALAAALGIAMAGAAGAERPSPFRLLSPGASDTWVAGTSATIEWEVVGDAASRAGLLEWEAFLSVDDGKTYAVRLTPHLDIDLLRFTFEVPRLPTRHARLLLRFGDEKQEHGFEVPWRFQIADAPVAFAPSGAVASLRTRRGESARANDPGVVLWIAGSRRGGGVRTEAARALGATLSGSHRLLAWPLYFFLGPVSPSRTALPPPTAEGGEDLPGGSAGVLPSERLAAARPPSIRLLIHRFNE